VVVDPADYTWVGEKLVNGGLTVEDRRGLAAKAFHTFPPTTPQLPDICWAPKPRVKNYPIR